ncbi:MAG: glycosyl hydrolase family 8, partial [Myxococcota bacterium]|nr:glycosyl hydrolase family 8 [Myxococcota bacterium]
MRRSSSLVFFSAAALLLPSFLACSSSDTSPPSQGGSGSNTSSGGSNGSGSSSGTVSGSGNTGGSGSNPGNSGSGVGTSGSASGSGGGGSGVSGGSGSVGGSGDGGSGPGPVLGPDGGPLTRACMPSSPDVLSDFEEGVGTLIHQGGRSGWWYVFHDTMGGSQTPTGVPNGPIAVEAAPADDKPGSCNMWAMHSTSAVHTGAAQYSGFGATFVPNGMSKTAYDLSGYSGIQFDIKTGSAASQGPIYLEMLTAESQPATGGGTATTQTIDLYNTRGRVLTSTEITTSMQTVYVPFSLLIPRYFPAPPATAGSTTGCPSGTVCQAPTFNPAHALGFQFSQYYDFNKTGGYDLWVDNVALYKGDQGLVPAGATLPTFSDGTGNGWKCTRPQFEGSNTAAGKYLYSAYQKWKARFVVPAAGGFRVQRPESNNDTVSEGIGYGMLIAVSMNDQPRFDGLW